MKNDFLREVARQAVLLFAATALAACGSSDDNDKGPDNGGGGNGGGTPAALYLDVSPQTLTFDGEGKPVGADAFTVATNGTWQAAADPNAAWAVLSSASGTGDGSVAITIPAPVAGGGRAEVTFTARDAQGATATRKVYVVQQIPTAPDPVDYTIDLDFAVGPQIATPALPGSSADAQTGRGEYTIAGHAFAVHADKAVNGKYFWVDNAQYSPTIPEPNKGLYFSKEGAYVEFPAIAGKALVEVLFTPTTSSGSEVDLEITDTDDMTVPQTLDYADDGSWVFTLVTPAADTRYRLEVVNTKNAQAARLVLTYR